MLTTMIFVAVLLSPLTKNFTRKHASNVDLISFTGEKMDLHKYALSTKNVPKVQNLRS